MPAERSPGKPTTRRYTDAEKDQAVRLVRKLRQELGTDHGRRSVAASARLAVMAFGHQSGPPASAREVQELLTLLQEAGHTDFRDARGPMGFTQRQAAGKFTRDEVAAFIDRLQDAEFDGSDPAAAPTARQLALEQVLRHMPAEHLAAELRHRGWMVTEP